jgi:FAD/FMN-containing dehydrogenase
VVELLGPEAAGYDAARRQEMARFAAIRPQAVALCATAADVAQAIAFARRHELATAIRSGGHCFAGHSSTDGLLIHVGPMTAVAVSADTVTVGAGTRLGDLYRGLAAEDRAIPGGCGPSVGISGLTLDWLATKRALNERAPGEGEDGDMYQRSGFFRQLLPADAIGELL